MAKLAPQAQLDKISTWLDQLYGQRLRSLVVYGSAAGGNHHSRHSDINLLAVFDTIDAALLDRGADAMRWWIAQGNPAPVMLSQAEVEDAADVFPIEFLDIRHHHRLLRGADPVANAPHFPELHRLQVEHDLRAQLLRLRARFVRASRDRRALEGLLLRSFSTFVTLFRHALVAVHEPLLIDKAEVVAAAAARFDFSAAPFQTILEARRSGARLANGKLESLQPLFAEYLGAIQRVERVLEDYRDAQP